MYICGTLKRVFELEGVSYYFYNGIKTRHYKIWGRKTKYTLKLRLSVPQRQIL
jgi:hypothetical protein